VNGRRRDRAEARYGDMSTEALIRHRGAAAIRSAQNALTRLDSLVRSGRVRPGHLTAVTAMADALVAVALTAVGDQTSPGEDV